MGWSSHPVDMSGYNPKILKKYGFPAIPKNLDIKGYDNYANFVMSVMNNATTLQQHELDNVFNAEQAELNREFNAEQAQIARDWNSEEAVVERRKEAGMNMVNPGGGSTSSGGGSSAFASGSPASSAPLPGLSNPQLTERDPANMVSAITNLAKAPAEIAKDVAGIDKSLSEVNKLQKDADYITQQTRYQEIVNTYTPEQLQMGLQFLSTQIREKDDFHEIQPYLINEKNAYADGVRSSILTNLVNSLVSMGNLDVNAHKATNDFILGLTELDNDLSKFSLQMEKDIISDSYKFGKKHSTTLDITLSKGIKEYIEKGLQGGLHGQAGVKGKGSLGFDLLGFIKQSNSEDNTGTILDSKKTEFFEQNQSYIDTMRNIYLGATLLRNTDNPVMVKGLSSYLGKQGENLQFLFQLQDKISNESSARQLHNPSNVVTIDDLLDIDINKRLDPGLPY